MIVKVVCSKWVLPYRLVLLEQALLDFIARVYTLMHWPGVVALMALGSAGIPIPSELIMSLSGWMLIREMGLSPTYALVAGVYGASGCALGSVVAYGVGMWGGRPILEKYGRYILISHNDLNMADRWFAQYGSWAAFICQLLPVVRTFIGLPAGIAGMHFVKFLIYTFIGSFIWCAGLAYGGYLLGEHWEELRSMMRPFDPLIGILLVALIVYYVYRHVGRCHKALKAE